MDFPLPVDKLSLGSVINDKTYIVVVATGSFNPPTFMHLRMFELARDALDSEGFCAIGGYMSPVNDAYGKQGLISAEHRVKMCDLACKSSDFIMVDSWEALQTTFQRTVSVLSRVKTICRDFGVVCIRREGQDIEKVISENEILSENRVNIKVVEELVPNQVSSTRVRSYISRGLSIRYLTVDEVVAYIKEKHLRAITSHNSRLFLTLENT